MQSNTPAAASCCSPRDSAGPRVPSRRRAITLIGTRDHDHPDWMITMAGIRAQGEENRPSVLRKWRIDSENFQQARDKALAQMARQVACRVLTVTRRRGICDRLAAGAVALGQRLLTILQYGWYRRARRQPDMAKLIVELPEEVHRELKRKATHEHRTIKDVVTDLVEGYLSLGRDAPARPAATGLCGRWKDPRTAAEILTDIKSRRRWFRGRRAPRG